MKNIKLECHEANHLCDKNQYKETTFWEKVRLTVHLIYCRACREYTKRNVQLTKLIKSPKVNTLEDSQRHAIQETFDKELLNQK